MEKQLIDVAATMPTVAPRSVVGAVAVQLNATMPGSMAYMKKSKSIAFAVKRERAKVIFYFFIFLTHMVWVAYIYLKIC